MELPNIYYVAIEDQYFRLYTFEVTQEFSCVATIGAQMNVRYNDDLYFAFFHRFEILIFEMD